MAHGAVLLFYITATASLNGHGVLIQVGALGSRPLNGATLPPQGQLRFCVANVQEGADLC